MILETVFGVLALVTLFSALKVVLVDELVHATIWLAVSLAGVAGVFVTVGAEFVATVQILVYIGAVVTLILFTIMLTLPREEDVDVEDLDLPPGYSIENVQDLQEVKPRPGEAPYHGRAVVGQPKREPDTYYGVHKDDREVG